MRIAVPVLSGLTGLTAMITGAYIRSCTMQPAALQTIWCGNPPADTVAAASQDHCGACALVIAGLVAIAGGVIAAICSHPLPALRRVRP